MLCLLCMYMSVIGTIAFFFSSVIFSYRFGKESLQTQKSQFRKEWQYNLQLIHLKKYLNYSGIYLETFVCKPPRYLLREKILQRLQIFNIFSHLSEVDSCINFFFLSLLEYCNIGTLDSWSIFRAVFVIFLQKLRKSLLNLSISLEKTYLLLISFSDKINYVNHFRQIFTFYPLLKATKNQRFSDVFKVDEINTLVGDEVTL